MPTLEHKRTSNRKQCKQCKNFSWTFQSPKVDLRLRRNAILNQIESERITKADILFNYESARKKGVDYDMRKDVYDKTQKFTLNDVTAFQQQYVKGKILMWC